METTSIHYSSDRKQRSALIEGTIGEGQVIDSFVVNKGHPGGEEVHSVTDTGIIVIRNKKTNKLITKLIARPEQLRRLYRSENKKVPRKVLSLAYKHNLEKYNII